MKFQKKKKKEEEETTILSKINAPGSHITMQQVPYTLAFIFQKGK